MNRFFLGAYWAARPDSLDECTDRLSRFFAELVTCDDVLGHWYELADSRRRALEKSADVGDPNYLRALLERGRHWTDMPRKLMKDLGFTFGLWNGQDETKSVGLSVTCGLYYEKLTNCVTLHLPQGLGRLKDARRMRRVLSAVATTWEPDWAGVMSDEAMERRRFNPKRPFVDWMLYVSDKWLPKIPTFEPPTTTEHLAAGTMIVVQEEPPDPCNPTHLENIKRVRATLRRRVKIDT